jgi:O-succinylbenzoic acid--CoA ligase
MHDLTSVPKLNRFRKVLIGGASMNNEWSRRFTDLDPEFYHTYGMTETYSHIALRKLNGAGATARYVPLPGAQVSKDREERLVINGPITKYADIVTNDRVKIYPDGSFEILGRMDNIINSGGVKIQLEKVDDAIMRLRQMRGRDFFTWYVPDEELGQKLITIIKGDPLEPMDEYEARVDLRSFLEKYEVPKQFYYVPHFVLTESGKVQRQKTAELALRNKNN